MLNQKRTKIVATMGPATKSKEILKNMILEGVNVFRINFSHADYNVVKENISNLLHNCPNSVIVSYGRK